MHNKKLKKFLKYLAVEIFTGLIIGGLFMLYSTNYTVIGIIDALTISTVMLFTVGWFMFISNEHLLDILFYGVASLGKAIVGKRSEKSYYEHIQSKEPVNGAIYWSLWTSSLIYGLALLILFIIYRT